MFIFIMFRHDVTQDLITHPLRGHRPADYHPAPDRLNLSYHSSNRRDKRNTHIASLKTHVLSNRHRFANVLVFTMISYSNVYFYLQVSSFTAFKRCKDTVK